MLSLTKLLIFSLQIVFFIVLFITLYELFSYLRDKNFDKKIKQGLKKIDSKDIENTVKDIQYVSKKKDFKYIKNLSLLIEQSGVSTKYRFITPSFVIMISIILALVSWVVSQNVIQILVPSILMAIIGYKVPSVVLNILVAINSDKITKKLIDFINLLKNFCLVKNDIVFAITASEEYLKEPLKSICSTFKYEVKHGFQPYDALENMKKKIDNNQYRLLIKNLQICSKHSNEFLKVLRNSEKLILNYLKEQTLRKKEIQRGVFGILGLVFLSALIFFMLIYINPMLPNLLRTSTIGKGIVTIIVAAYLVAIFVCEKLARFNF